MLISRFLSISFLLISMDIFSQENAMKLFQDGEFDKCWKELEKTKEKNRSNQFHVVRVECGIKLYPISKELNILMSSLSSIDYLSRYSKAFEDIQKLKDLKNRFKVGMLNLATQSYSAAKFDQAFIGFAYVDSLAQLHDERDSTALFNGAICAENAVKLDRANELYGACVELSIGGVKAVHGQLRILRKLNKEEAVRNLVLTQILRYEDDHVLIKEAADVYGFQNQFDRVVNVLEKGVTHFPEDAEFHYALAEAYRNTENFEASEEHYVVAFSIDPSNYFAQYDLAVLYYNKGVDLIREANEIQEIGKHETKREEALSMYRKSMENFESCLDKNLTKQHFAPLTAIYVELGLHDKLKELDKKF